MADIRFDAHVDLQKNQLLNALLHPVSADPGSPTEGQVWYNSSEGRMKIRLAGSTGSIAFMADVTSGSITGALWDANTIIKADTDDTPVALVVAEGTVVGRLAGGAIAALTAANLRTLINVENGATADQTPAEILTALLTVDGAGSGLDADLLDGLNASAFALKSELDAAVNGLAWKDSVRAATTANITLSGAQTIDTVAVIAGDRVLVKNQTTPAQNGIYVAAAGAWARSADADTADELEAAAVMVEEGSQAGTAWIQTLDNFTLGSGSVTWAQFGAGQAYAAGSGLTLTGNTFSIGTGAITDAMLATTTFTKKYSADIGNGSSTQITVNHGLGKTDVIVQVREVSSGQAVLVDWRVIDANNVRIDFNTAPASSSRRVTVIG